MNKLYFIFYKIVYLFLEDSLRNKILFLLLKFKYDHVNTPNSISSLYKDIVLYTNKIDSILQQDILFEKIRVDDITNDTLKEYDIYLFLTDNNKILTNEYNALYVFFNKALQLITVYNELDTVNNKKIIQNDNTVNSIVETNYAVHSYNCRRLKPYIINIESIVDQFL